MKYRRFDFTTDFVETICTLDKDGNRKYVCGYLCRVYHHEDIMHEKPLAEFYLRSSEAKSIEPYWEIRAVMDYINKNYITIMKTHYRIDSEKAYTILTDICEYLFSNLSKKELEDLCEDIDVPIGVLRYIKDFENTHYGYYTLKEIINDYKRQS